MSDDLRERILDVLWELARGGHVYDESESVDKVADAVLAVLSEVAVGEGEATATARGELRVSPSPAVCPTCGSDNRHTLYPPKGEPCDLCGGTGVVTMRQDPFGWTPVLCLRGCIPEGEKK